MMRRATTRTTQALAPLLITVMAGCASVPAKPSTGLNPPLARLQGLVGEWEARTESGATIHVSYESLARGSVLLERFTMPGGAVSVTAYVADGSGLSLTHYCAQGNQPRLREVAGAAGEVRFEFQDATGLSGPGAAHMVALILRLPEGNRFTQESTYAAGAERETTKLQFVRK